MIRQVEFRPHHFCCALGFVGKGYSAEFVANFQAIADRLRASPDGDSTVIRVVGRTDSICGPCPSRRGELCESQGKIDTLDAAHAAVLGLKPGDELTWAEAKRRIAERMTDAAFESSCAACSWKGLGVCKSALEANRKAHSKKAFSWMTAALLLGASVAHAEVTPAPAVSPPPIISPVQSVDLLRDQIFKTRKSKDARRVGRALEALRQKKFAEARALARPLQRTAMFADYGYAITAAAHRAEAKDLFEKKRFAEAEATARRALPLFLKVEADHPYSPLLRRVAEDLGHSELVVAESLQARGRHSQALAEYERAFQRLSASNALGEVEPETLGRYSESCSKSLTALCQAWVQKFTSVSPKGSEELKAIAKFFPEAALKPRPSFPSRLTQAYKAPDLDLTAFENAMTLYNDGKYSGAIKGFQQFLDEFPRSGHRFRARYWLAQALSHEQEHERAQKAYEELLRESPLSYYGLLASMASGKSLDSVIDGTLPGAQPTDPFLPPLETQRLARAERFIAEGVGELAMQDLRDFRTRSHLSNAFLMYLATLNYEAGGYGTGFSILQDMLNRGYEGVISSYGLRLIFPVVHFEAIKRHCDAIKLDPILVLSLMKQESAFDANAVSSVGAAGLMQLMPATAIDTEAGVKRVELTDPEINIRVGTKYLKKMLTRYNGNIAFALAAYNAGPGAVDRWIRENRAKRGLIDFIEQIPYKETREYVGGIIRNYYWYAKRVNGEAPKSLNVFWNVYGPPETPDVLPALPPPPPAAVPESASATLPAGKGEAPGEVSEL